MELVLGHHTLHAAGGSETYLLTVAEQLQRLGHEVTIYTLEPGPMATVATARGVRVTSVEHELPTACDGVLAQDGVTSLALAARYEHAPQLFVAHAPGIDLQRPVQIDGVIAAVIVLNDRVGRRMEGLAHRHEIVRLRQPIDVQRFTPRGGPRATPERVLLLSNYAWGAARHTLESACTEAGMRFEHVGTPARSSLTPEVEIAASDITVAVGRAALEGMASGRCVYVLDRFAGDGWVTPDSYPAFESDGFGGLASNGTIDAARLRRDLARYDRQMGVLNRQLIFKRHHAMEHARELVELLRRLAPGPPRPRAPLDEMARLVRVQWQAESRAATLAAENAALRDEIERERVEARAEVASAYADLAAFQHTRRYRFARLLARPLDVLRRRGG